MGTNIKFLSCSYCGLANSDGLRPSVYAFSQEEPTQAHASQYYVNRLIPAPWSGQYYVNRLIPAHTSPLVRPIQTRHLGSGYAGITALGALYEVHYASKTLISLGLGLAWRFGAYYSYDGLLAACRVRREGWEECFAVFGSFQWLEPCLVLGL